MDVALFVRHVAVASCGLAEPEPTRSSTFILVALLAIAFVAFALLRLGVIGWVLGIAGGLIRRAIQSGFRTWERFLAWMPWPLFLALQIAFLSVGAAAADSLPLFAIVCALAPLAVGLVACLAYMFIDIERYEVARGYKALHDPMKGQRLATELSRYGHQVGLPLLGAAAVGMVGGFALLNFALFGLFGSRWYVPPGREAIYFDFLASAILHLLSVVDLLNVAASYNFERIAVARPAGGFASGLLAVFRSFFTLVLLQQIFASVRKGRLLAETIADFWSPHEPIHQRARNSLPQYGGAALGPLLLSLRTAETLTREQREQLPAVLATIGPAAIPHLLFHLDDSNEHVRAVAVATLGRLRVVQAVGYLTKLGEDPSDLVRLSLAEALGEIGSQAVPAEQRVLSRSTRLLGRFLGRRAPLLHTPDPIGAAFRTLQSALGDRTAAVRAQAANSLGFLGPSAGDAVADLIGLLSDSDETVRGNAATALGQVGASNAETVPALAALLEDASPALRAGGAAALGSLRAVAAPAVPFLVPLLQDRDETVRKAAADAVGRIGVLTEAATEILTNGLSSSDNVVRARAAEALGDIGQAAADTASALVAAAEDDNDRVRGKAIQALGKIGEAASEIAVPRLVRALKDPDNWVSALAAEALGEMGNGADGAIPALARSLKHVNPQVRANAAEALAKLGTAAASVVPALQKAAVDEDGGVRLGALRALGAAGPPSPQSAQVVRAALADPDPEARAAAAEAFGLWGEADDATRAEILLLLDDANDAVKARTIRVLPKLAGAAAPGVVESLTHRLGEDDSDWVRVEAARALGQFGSAAVPAGAALLRAAQTGEAGLREEAMRALALSQPPEAAEAFASGLRDAEPQVRKLASAGWRKAVAVPDEAIPALIEALHDPDVRVRSNAAHAIGRLDPVPAEAIPLLQECVAHSDIGLRLSAALALQAVTGAAAVEALYPFLGDPNPRIRLIAARCALIENNADTAAIEAVAKSLVVSEAGIRKAAMELIETVRLPAATLLGILQGETSEAAGSTENDSLAESIEWLRTRAEAEAASEPAGDAANTPAS